MSVEDAKNISVFLKQLESTSSAVVYKGLHDVRYKLLKSPEGVQLFRQNNGLKYLLRFVRKPNEKILDLTLSILANLCLEEYFRTKVAEENGLVSHLLSLLAHVQKDSIVGRTCRLIGNLATSKAIAIKLHNKGAVSKLIECIKSKDNSPATKHMAVRALRLLWEAEISRTKMLQEQVVQTIASLLTTQVDELLQAVLKALAVFTNRCNEQCALQIQGDGKGFEELVACIKHCSKSELAVSVILNLCYVPEVRPLLGTAGVVEAITDLLNGKEPSQCTSDIVTVLCLLCRESVNRSKVRRSGGLEVLLGTLRHGGNSNLEARALNAMLHFIYDEVGLEILMKEGLVPVLVQKLLKVVDKHGRPHLNPMSEDTSCSSSKRIRLSRMREEKVSPLCSSACDPLGLRTRDYASTSVRPDALLGGHWSPGSSRSVEFSPDTTRTYSPSPLGANCSPTSSALSPSHSPPPSPQSDAYSPVCGYSSSEDEKPDDTDADAAGDCEADSDCEVTSPCLNDKDDVEDIQEALNASLPSNGIPRHGLIESWCLLMLSRVSHRDTLADDMVSSSTVDTLLQYYTLLEPPHPRAARVLQRITRNHHCLIPLLRAGLIMKVNERLMVRVHEDCSRCMDFDWLGSSLLSQLAMLAESGFGEGEILHHLMCASRSVQAFIIVSVPYIVRSRRLQTLIMLDGKINNRSGLDLLLQLMTNECGDGLSDEAVDSISHFAQQIGVSYHESKTSKVKLCKRGSDCSLNGLEISNDEPSDDIVVLELDNGATVRAPRQELCQESPMFSAMLTGGFCESGSQHVSLKDVSEEYLLALLSLMHANNRCGCCLPRKDTDFAFGVLKLADRFILPKVIDKVTNWLIAQLAPDVISSTYLQAVNLRHVLSISKKISEESLHFALVQDMERAQRRNIFSTILDSNHKGQFVDDITELIKFHAEHPSRLY